MSKKNHKITIEDLAVITKKGFDSVDKKFDAVDKSFKEVNENLKGLADGQERIELRLSNVAYRFEVVELEKRVEKLELKLNIKHS